MQKEKLQKVLSPKATLAISKACYCCEREYTEMQMIGPTTYRCRYCIPGSYNWREYWIKQPEHERPAIITEALKLYEHIHTRRES